MRVIKTIAKNDEYPKRVLCENCGANLEYEKEDEFIGWMGCKNVICPECGDATFVTERVVKPTWNATFNHTSTEYGAKEIGNEKTQKYIDEVVSSLVNCNEEFTHHVMVCGNTLVVGIKCGDDGIDIYVTKDYYGDMLAMEDYNLIK